MTRRASSEQLTAIEAEAIDKIRKLRSFVTNNHNHARPKAHAAYMHDILSEYNGNVKLRIQVIAKALGTNLRTIEREFFMRYDESMKHFQERTRLEAIERQIRFDPSVKLAALAEFLGYDRNSELTRFFRHARGYSLLQFKRRIQHDPDGSPK